MNKVIKFNNSNENEKNDNSVKKSDVDNSIFGLLIKPESETPDVIEIKVEYNTEKGQLSFDNDLRSILNIKEDKMPLYMSLYQPLQNFVMVLNPDLLTDDSKYNFGYVGAPIFGNALILQTKIDENQDGVESDSVLTKIVSTDEKTLLVLSNFFENMKKEERFIKGFDTINKIIEEQGKENFIKYLEDLKNNEGK